jgi:hypothetical protein
MQMDHREIEKQVKQVTPLDMTVLAIKDAIRTCDELCRYRALLIGRMSVALVDELVSRLERLEGKVK